MKDLLFWIPHSTLTMTTTPTYHDTEDVLLTGVGNRFNWIVASQAFLFAASAVRWSLSPDGEDQYIPLFT